MGTERFVFNLTGKRSLKTEIVSGGSEDNGTKKIRKSKRKKETER